MRLEYEISESDYGHGVSRSARPREDRKDFVKRLGLQLVGLLLVVVVIFVSVRSGFTLAAIPLLLLGLILVLLYPLGRSVISLMISLSTRKYLKQEYRNAPALRGKWLLEVDERSVAFAAAGFSLKAGWAEFAKFSEDRRVFILYQRNPQSPPPFIFHIVPKRALSRDQITGLRQHFEKHIHADGNAGEP